MGVKSFILMYSYYLYLPACLLLNNEVQDNRQLPFGCIHASLLLLLFCIRSGLAKQLIYHIRSS